MVLPTANTVHRPAGSGGPCVPRANAARVVVPASTSAIIRFALWRCQPIANAVVPPAATSAAAPGPLPRTKIIKTTPRTAAHPPRTAIHVNMRSSCFKARMSEVCTSHAPATMTSQTRCGSARAFEGQMGRSGAMKWSSRFTIPAVGARLKRRSAPWLKWLSRSWSAHSPKRVREPSRSRAKRPQRRPRQAARANGQRGWDHGRSGPHVTGRQLWHLAAD